MQISSSSSPSPIPAPDLSYGDPSSSRMRAGGRPSMDQNSNSGARRNVTESPSPTHVQAPPYTYGMRSTSYQRTEQQQSTPTPSRSRTQRTPNQKSSPLPSAAAENSTPVPVSGLPPPRRARAMTLQSSAASPTPKSNRPPSWIEFPDLDLEVLRLKAEAEAEKKAISESSSYSSSHPSEDEPLRRHPTQSKPSGVQRSMTSAQARPPVRSETSRAAPLTISNLSSSRAPRPSLTGGPGIHPQSYSTPPVSSGVPRPTRSTSAAVPPTPTTPTPTNTQAQSYFATPAQQYQQQVQQLPPPQYETVASSSPPDEGRNGTEPYRIYVENKQQYVKVALGVKTTAGDVLKMVKESGQLKSEGGGGMLDEKWAGGLMVYEIATDFGMG